MWRSQILISMRNQSLWNHPQLAYVYCRAYLYHSVPLYTLVGSHTLLSLGYTRPHVHTYRAQSTAGHTAPGNSWYHSSRPASLFHIYIPL